jgi:hypothetical protein
MATKSLKDILTRLCERVNYRQTSVTGTAVTIAGGGGTVWHTVPLPSSGTAVAVTGYYLNGGYNCKVYSVNLAEGRGAQFALRNDGSSSATVTITAYYLVVD